MTEDKGNAFIKKKARGKKLQSGKTAKLTSRVLAPQHWPHSFLSLAYVSKQRPYDELTVAEFAAGYASILQLNSLPPGECSGRLDHFIVLMYLVTQFPWPVVREFHVAVLFEIEYGRACWGDLFAQQLNKVSVLLAPLVLCYVAVISKPGNAPIQSIIMARSVTKESGYSTFAPDVGCRRAPLRGTLSFLQSVPDLRLLRVSLSTLPLQPPPDFRVTRTVCFRLRLFLPPLTTQDFARFFPLLQGQGHVLTLIFLQWTPVVSQTCLTF